MNGIDTLILNIYNEYPTLFFGFLVLLLTYEGPAVLLIIAALAPKLGLNFRDLYALSIVGDMLGDNFRYLIGRFSGNRLEKLRHKTENVPYLKTIDRKLKTHKLLDVLMLVKYTPFLSTGGFLYLGYKKVNYKQFLIHTTLMILIYSFILASLGYHFGRLFAGTHNLVYLLAGLGLGMICIYFLVRFISNFLVKKIVKLK